MDHNRSRKNSDHTDCTNKENAKPSFGKKNPKISEKFVYLFGRQLGAINYGHFIHIRY